MVQSIHGQMPEYSDYAIHRLSDKHRYYADERKLWWSKELGRWMCVDPMLIKSILADDDFRVMSYSVDKITERLGIDLDHVKQLLRYFPLAQEGEAHKSIRKRHAMAIAEKSDQALQDFRISFEQKLAELASGSERTVDLLDGLLKPALQQFFATLSGIEKTYLNGSDSISQILDETLGLSKRVAINEKIQSLLESLPPEMSLDEKYFRISIVALGTDSMLGTLSQSLVTVLKRYPAGSPAEMHWDEELPATGVPVIERWLSADKTIGATSMQAGQRIRLYLDAAGYDHAEAPAYSALYFGSGSHLCLGMPVGRKLWKLITALFQTFNKKLTMIEANYREHDNVFNLYDTIKVKINE